MVHTFKYQENYYIYDTGSGALHICDENASLLLKEKQGEKVDTSHISRIERAEYEKTFDALKKQGLLFKEEPASYPEKWMNIKALCLHVCHDCNLRCKYCFADEGAYHGERSFMSLEMAKKAIDFLIANSGERKILETDFFGGEPLMNFDVVKEAVYYGKEQAAKVGKKYLFTMTTNGLLLNDKIADFLNAEMDNVILSLDGRQETHDAVRKTVNGKGSFDAVFHNIKNFVQKRGNKSYYVRGTYTAKNLDFADDVLFLVENGIQSISFEPVVTEVEELKITPAHLEKVDAEYERLAKAYVDKMRAGKEFHFFHFNLDLDNAICLHKKVNACGAGTEYLSVLPNGDIYPCHQFASQTSFKMGNLNDKNFQLEKSVREQFKHACLFTRKGCENCFAKFICSGGCHANNNVANGDINIPHSFSCHITKKRLELAMHLLAEKKKYEAEQQMQKEII